MFALFWDFFYNVYMENKEKLKKKTTTKKASENKKSTAKKVTKQKNEENLEIKAIESLAAEPKVEEKQIVEQDLKTSKKEKPKKVKTKKEKTSKEKKPRKKLTKKQIIMLISIISVSVLVLAGITVWIVLSTRPKVTVSSLQIVSAQTQNYRAFDEFDDSSLNLMAKYSDGSESKVESGWRVWYVSTDGETLHDDCFYGGESILKIEYGGKFCELEIEAVEKIDRIGAKLSLTRYSQIADGNAVNLPSSHVSVTAGYDVELVYVKNFTTFSNYQPTTTDDGAVSNGKAPVNANTYYVFAKIAGDNNYKDKFSNVAELNIVDEDLVTIFAKGEEVKFGYKEMTNIQGNVFATGNDYIEFEITGDKKIIYTSSFAGSGTAVIFKDEIELDNGTQKVQLLQKNNEICIKNGEIITKTLTKWHIPSIAGTYEKVITIAEAAEKGVTISENKTCVLDINYEETQKDGDVMFVFNGYTYLPNSSPAEITEFILEGTIVYSVDQSGNMIMKFVTTSQIEEFSINILQNDFEIVFGNNLFEISNGNYIKK